ncbi:MORN repeat-containing protein [Noviherbaspirillum sedimenti]|nr:hypothetical protein [Noviherbaspirillum sedimenti]
MMRLISMAGAILLLAFSSAASAGNAAPKSASLPAASSSPGTGAPLHPDALTADGGKYYGPLVDGKLHGTGMIEWANGIRYEGEFEHGQFSGKGKLKSTSFEYEGEFRNGMMAGHGRSVGTDGAVYVGQFANQLFHGHGRYETAGKESYEGDFVKGEFDGNGVHQRSDGSRHAGSFRDWRAHGLGTYTDTKGNIYEGVFADGDLNGKARLSGKDGRRYEGEFRNWQYHGQGVFRAANGDEYKGGFAYGVFDGNGTYTYARPQKDGRVKDVGTWRYGRLEDPAAERQAKDNVEIALYNQNALLARTLAALSPREPGKINLYLLAVGGDGSQEVFRREVEFVRTQFDRDFGTQGRSVALINSRSTVAKVPMATLTSGL